jgi:hypothetical protein
MSFGVFNVVERVERRNSSNLNKAYIINLCECYLVGSVQGSLG